MQWYSPLEDEDYDLSVQSQPHRERLVWIGNDECLLLCDMGSGYVVSKGAHGHDEWHDLSRNHSRGSGDEAFFGIVRSMFRDVQPSLLEWQLHV